MAFVIYKKFPIKALRAAATLTVSAVWHGWAPGYFMTICQVALYLPPEDIWMKIRENLPSESLVLIHFFQIEFFKKKILLLLILI